VHDDYKFAVKYLDGKAALSVAYTRTCFLYCTCVSLNSFDVMILE